MSNTPEQGRSDPDPASSRTPRDQATPAQATFRLLTSRGFAPIESGNLTAYLTGLRPVKQGWTTTEIGRLLFLRHLVERGRLDS